MSVPNHGSSCITHTFPCRCPHCASPVFYFSCSCGSKVFFETLDPPLTEHECLPMHVGQLRKKGYNGEEIRRIVEAHAVEKCHAIPTALLDGLDLGTSTVRREAEILTLLPDGSEFMIEGDVTNVNLQ